MKKTISILGSTGSIGQNTLKVVENLKGFLKVKYLTAARSSSRLVEQANKFQPEAVAIVDDQAYNEVRDALSGSKIQVLGGREGVIEIATRDDVDVMLNALVGSAGMEPTIRAIEAGVNVALSNKESLVMAGEIINGLKEKTGAEIYPVDSEHSAIWQCLSGEVQNGISRIILTGSGGPFRTKSIDEFSKITVSDALKHPTWEMGKKITIDSATMMNKGLEVIEAYWLFGVRTNQIEVVIHPQSIIHSMVEFVDGSVKAQLGLPDMKIPIQYALTYPHRQPSRWEEIDFSSLEMLTFEKPDLDKFRCVQLAYDVLEQGGSAPAALNVANDNAVKFFLEGKIPFSQISTINEMAVQKHDFVKHPDLDYLLELEEWGKRLVSLGVAATVSPGDCRSPD